MHSSLALITCSHRPSLYKYHKHLLELSGNEGGWKLVQLDSAAQHASIQKEIDALEKQLAEEDSMKQRIAEISQEMAFV